MTRENGTLHSQAFQYQAQEFESPTLRIAYNNVAREHAALERQDVSESIRRVMDICRQTETSLAALQQSARHLLEASGRHAIEFNGVSTEFLVRVQGIKDELRECMQQLLSAVAETEQSSSHPVALAGLREALMRVQMLSRDMQSVTSVIGEHSDKLERRAGQIEYTQTRLTNLQSEVEMLQEQLRSSTNKKRRQKLEANVNAQEKELDSTIERDTYLKNDARSLLIADLLTKKMVAGEELTVNDVLDRLHAEISAINPALLSPSPNSVPLDPTILQKARDSLVKGNMMDFKIEGLRVDIRMNVTPFKEPMPETYNAFEYELGVRIEKVYAALVEGLCTALHLVRQKQGRDTVLQNYESTLRQITWRLNEQYIDPGLNSILGPELPKGQHIVDAIWKLEEEYRTKYSLEIQHFFECLEEFKEAAAQLQQWDGVSSNLPELTDACAEAGAFLDLAFARMSKEARVYEWLKRQRMINFLTNPISSIRRWIQEKMRRE